MKIKTNIYAIYDLANEHFKNVEIITKQKQKFIGQFVRFKVNGPMGQCVYPAEEYCFLPEENRTIFWSEYKANNGEFSELPAYIKMMGLDELLEIIIKPVMIV